LAQIKKRAKKEIGQIRQSIGNAAKIRLAKGKGKEIPFLIVVLHQINEEGRNLHPKDRTN
jgi:hypothetical protein